MITTDTPLLLPPPRPLARQAGNFDVLRSGTIHLGGPAAADLWFTATQLQSRLVEISRQPWPIRAGLETAVICLLVDSSLSGGPAAYRLTLSSESIEIRAGSPAGVFYGCQTLYQLLRQYGPYLPCLHSEDGPDFPVRGFMLDISRDRVPMLATLLALVDRLAEWKINHLQLYTEHTFAYTGHEAVWQHASPLTGAEILQLDAYCRERFIDLVPNQASFGHMERWLKHPGYRSLAESPNGWVSSLGHPIPDPVTLNPLHSGSLDLVARLYQDLLPHFRSRFFNINGDETFELGQGACREAVQARGKEATG